jgi:hypothetical protein
MEISMSPKRYNEDKQRFVDYLETLPQNEATRLICLISVGAVNAIRTDYALWDSVERTVFNGTVLMFCDDKLANKELTEMINFAIQIDDLRGFKGNAVTLEDECRDIEARAMAILTKNERSNG